VRTIALTAAALLLVYHLLLANGFRPAAVTLPDQNLNNRIVVERFAAAAPYVAVVGSSMSRAIDIHGDCVYKLALAGGSSLTGLAVIATKKVKPRRVYVEINVPRNSVQEDLVADAGSMLLQVSPAFHAENMPVNLAYYSVQRFAAKPAPAIAGDEVFRSNLALQRAIYEKPMAESTLQDNIAKLRGYTAQLEGAGIEVVLFELPVHPELEQLPLARQIRAAFRSAFPDNRLLAADYFAAGLAMRTRDGVHLNSTEARQVLAMFARDWLSICPRPMKGAAPI